MRIFFLDGQLGLIFGSAYRRMYLWQVRLAVVVLIINFL